MTNKQNSEKFDTETSKLQPVNLPETSRDTAGVHQRAADSLESLCNDGLINVLFYTKCLDVHPNEKIIILKLALYEYKVTSQTFTKTSQTSFQNKQCFR